MSNNLRYTQTQGKKGDGSRAATPAQVTQLVMQEAQRRGLSWFRPHHAAGMVGSFMQETGNFRNDVINFNVRGDNGTAHGLMQWRGKRFTNLLSFAKRSNINATDIRTQVAFAFEEATPNSPYSDFGSVRALRNFQKTRTVQEAAVQFIHAERPAGYDGNPANAHDAQKRANHAVSAFNGYDQVSVNERQNQGIPGQADGSVGQGNAAVGQNPNYVHSPFNAFGTDNSGYVEPSFDQGQTIFDNNDTDLNPESGFNLDPLGILKFSSSTSTNPFLKQETRRRSYDAFGA